MSKPVLVSAEQARIHMLSEAVGVFVTVPFFFYASKELPHPTMRKVAFALGIGALAVDGWLFYRYTTKTTNR